MPHEMRENSKVSSADEQAVAPEPGRVTTIAHGRVVLDPERFFSSTDRDRIDPSDPLFSEWSRMRRTIAVFPFPRGERGPLAEALLRDEVEYSAETIATRSGCRWIVDQRLDSLFEIDPDPLDATRMSIRTGYPASTNEVRAESWSRAFLRRFTGRPSESVAERIEIAPGILTTATGGRRVNLECVTSIFHEAGSTDRIDVRIISERRTVRLRFDSRSDPRFLAFWPRWRAEAPTDPASVPTA